MTASWSYGMLIIPGTFVLSWVLTLFIRRAALARQVIDIPNDRSCHVAPTPRGGGMAFIVAFMAACFVDILMGGRFSAPGAGRILTILAPLAILGLADDIHDLPARLRLSVHLGVGGLALLLFPEAASFLGDSAGVIILASALIIVSTAACINFYNFMDGTDALVSGCFAMQGLFFAFYFHQSIWLIAVAGVLGFLYWNRPPAKIFMGDAGSTVLGGSTACAIIAGLQQGPAAIAALAVTLPLTADAVYTIVRRLLRADNIFQAHRQHIYQRLHINADWPHGRIAMVYILLTALFGALVMSFEVKGAWMSSLICLLLIPTAEAYLGRTKDRRQL